MSDVLLVARSMFKRMSRDRAGLIVGLLVPLTLIPIMGAVFSRVPKDIPYLRGVGDPMTFFAFGFLVMFQLFGGNYSLGHVKAALLGPMGWRMRAAPCRASSLVMGIVAAATAICLCQGLVIIALTRFALGVRWPNLGVALAVLVGISLLTQLVYLSLLLAFRNSGPANSLGWLFSYGSCLAGGLIFPLPDNALGLFLTTYGGPYSLAQTALRESGPGGSAGKAALCLAVLFLAAALVAAFATALGKRKLA